MYLAIAMKLNTHEIYHEISVLLEHLNNYTCVVT